MKLFTCFVTHERLHLTQIALESYFDTVSVPYDYVIVDNASTDGTQEWLRSNHGSNILLLTENLYPGRACNIGWSYAPPDATHLQRADNDMRFLPGWCEVMKDAFNGKRVGQVGLRTNEEELNCASNVGGNCVITRELFDQGLRYDERPWGEFPTACSEDTYFSPAVKKMGHRWTRVSQPCLVDMATGDPADPYYQTSYGVRGIW